MLSCFSLLSLSVSCCSPKIIYSYSPFAVFFDIDMHRFLFFPCFFQNDDQMSLSCPIDSEFFRILMAEEGGNVKELLDAEEYLVPQPGGIFSTQGEMRANGPSRHHSHRVRDNFILSFHLVIIYALLLFQTCFCFC